jgi:hypothetical protein
MADCVEKLLFADDRKFSEPLHQSPQNHPLTFVSILRSLALAESPTCNICEIFEAPRFSSFNTIGTNQTNRPACRCPLIGIDRKWQTGGQNDAFDP